MLKGHECKCDQLYLSSKYPRTLLYWLSHGGVLACVL